MNIEPHPTVMIGKQGELAEKLFRRLTEDAQAMLALGHDFSTEPQNAAASFMAQSTSA